MKYRTIVVDPPWPYEGFASDPTSGRGLHVKRAPPTSYGLPYESIPVKEMGLLPIESLADKDCRLFLWATTRYLPDAFDLLAAWSFIYAQTLVWVKTGNPSPFGGHLSPNHAEFLLVGTRGKVPTGTRFSSSVIHAPAQRQHSRKPAVFIDLVESVSPGPYLEMFARRQRLGWDTWGNECFSVTEAWKGVMQKPDP